MSKEDLMTTSIRSRQGLSLAVLGGLLVGTMAIFASPADAGVDGGCDGSVDFTADSAGAYGPDNDTTDNPIIVPKADGNVAMWEGQVPGNNENFSGTVDVRIGPLWIEVADWGFPNFDGTNDLDGRGDFGDYDMDEFWDAVGNKDLIQGIYEARATHVADGVRCTAQFLVCFEGDPLDSPVVMVTIAMLVIALILLVIAGRRKLGAEGTFNGRPVLAVIAALLLAITIAILLQQYCKVPLNNATMILLPIALIIIGLIIAKVAPFGGPKPAQDSPSTGDRLPSGMSRTADGEDVPDGGDIFTDGDSGGANSRNNAP